MALTAAQNAMDANCSYNLPATDAPGDAKDKLVVAIVNLADLTTAIWWYIDDMIPNGLFLSQNYPNPFIPTTTIEIAFPENRNVQQIVYDNIVHDMPYYINGNLNVGYHVVTFNVSPLFSGIYFYSLGTGYFQSIKIFIVLT